MAAAVCLFPFAAQGFLSWTSVFVGVSLALLFAANALLIAGCESKRDRKLGEASAATRWPHFVARLDTYLLIAVVVGVVASLTIVWGTPLKMMATLAAIMSISFGGLLVVSRWEFSEELKPIAADLALLAPWFVILYEL